MNRDSNGKLVHHPLCQPGDAIAIRACRTPPDHRQDACPLCELLDAAVLKERINGLILPRARTKGGTHA